MKVYVAGPFGFTTAGSSYLDDVVVPALTAAGWTVLNPWTVGASLLSPVLSDADRRSRELRSACQSVGEANAAMIREADAVLALLDGCDLDSGTCSEIGYAAALTRPISALRTD